MRRKERVAVSRGEKRKRLEGVPSQRNKDAKPRLTRIERKERENETAAVERHEGRKGGESTEVKRGSGPGL